MKENASPMADPISDAVPVCAPMPEARGLRPDDGVLGAVDLARRRLRGVPSRRTGTRRRSASPRSSAASSSGFLIVDMQGSFAGYIQTVCVAAPAGADAASALRRRPVRRRADLPRLAERLPLRLGFEFGREAALRAPRVLGGGRASGLPRARPHGDPHAQDLRTDLRVPRAARTRPRRVRSPPRRPTSSRCGRFSASRSWDSAARTTPSSSSGARLTHLFGVDTRLIDDGTYFVVEEPGRLRARGVRRLEPKANALRRRPVLGPLRRPARSRDGGGAHPGVSSSTPRTRAGGDRPRC